MGTKEKANCELFPKEGFVYLAHKVHWDDRKHIVEWQLKNPKCTPIDPKRREFKKFVDARRFAKKKAKQLDLKHYEHMGADSFVPDEVRVR